MKEKRGGKPFGSKIYKLGLTGCDPREAKDKGSHCFPGRKGVGVTMIRSLPAGLAGDGNSDNSSHWHGVQMTSIQ